VVGAVDLATGSAVVLSIPYLAPVAFVAWYARYRHGHGLHMAVLSALVWFAVNRAADGSANDVVVSAWNTLMRLGFFAVVGSLVAQVRLRVEELEALATTDALTGVRNGRFFRDAIAAEVVRCRRHPQPFTVVYIDLDGFKKVNDKHGHDAGDRVLKTVGRSLRSGFRELDVVARLGGDEFAALLPATDRASAVAAVRRANALVEESIREGQWPVTLSVGAVTFETPPGDERSALQEADALMYEIKTSGKNATKFGVR
jgi:diguanylate cyclase (GGDEF)-like protein